jgi:hypothetical protein
LLIIYLVGELLWCILTAVLIYHFSAVECSKWVLKIDKIRRGFMCWSRVSPDLGGLGIHNLEMVLAHELIEAAVAEENPALPLMGWDEYSSAP